MYAVAEFIASLGSPKPTYGSKTADEMRKLEDLTPERFDEKVAGKALYCQRCGRIMLGDLGPGSKEDKAKNTACVHASCFGYLCCATCYEAMSEPERDGARSKDEKHQCEECGEWLLAEEGKPLYRKSKKQKQPTITRRAAATAPHGLRQSD
jgi:hypothetical protein